MRVPVHGAILGRPERDAVQEVMERGWITAGPAAKTFERRLRDFTGAREVVLCNSGSSANLLAVSALAQPELGERAIMPGDEVVTTALNFPTTLAPILQVGAMPVLIDVRLPDLTPSHEMVRDAMTENTKAIMLAHTLGMPLNMPALRALANERGVWLVEDCCDALGSPWTMHHADLSTLSFYPAHQITTGEGGAVLASSPRLGKILRSLRDWGRDCWCDSGQDNACGRRFDGDYDHKYTYSRMGYHLAMTDMQAAIGAAQMDRLNGFVGARARNHAYLHDQAQRRGLERHFMLPQPVFASWFGFALICREHVDRRAVTRYLEGRGVQTRLIFGGNLLRQPAFRNARRVVHGDLANTDIVHERAFWVGCWPGLEPEQLDYIVQCLVDFVEGA